MPCRALKCAPALHAGTCISPRTSPTPALFMKSFAFGAAAALVSLTTACSYDPTYPSPTPPPKASADVVFCSLTAPKWVAVQDGDGTWAPAAPQTSGALTAFHL